MTEVRYAPGRLTVTGHAGAGKRGRDLVCAALSILAETAAALPGAQERRSEGWIQIRAEPEALRVLCGGFRLLARDYPQYVTYEEEEA